MNKGYVAISLLMLANLGCASERLYVMVVDNEGNPVSNATVKVGFSSSHVIFGGGHRSSGGGDDNVTARTDTNGNAVVKFNCTSSDFGWRVEAEGYYSSESRQEHFKGEDVIIPPAFAYVILHEHEKRRAVTVWKKINPQSMYSYQLSNWPNSRQKVPDSNGRYGFDLKLGAWLPPLGKGVVADFYYVRNIGDGHSEDGSVEWLEFDNGCGAYLAKQTGCKEFPSTYCANTNAVYTNRLPFAFTRKNTSVGQREIAAADEYIVLRTRVKVDSKGNILEANYSKILGPFRFDLFIKTPCVVFNHRVNDPNLESDCRRNMLKQFNSNGYPP